MNVLGIDLSLKGNFVLLNSKDEIIPTVENILGVWRAIFLSCATASRMAHIRFEKVFAMSGQLV